MVYLRRILNNWRSYWRKTASPDADLILHVMETDEQILGNESKMKKRQFDVVPKVVKM